MTTQAELTSSLPAAHTSFIGRSQELSEICSLLRTTRLLTLTGPGGCGKTRLAREVASNIRLEFLDGVWWCDLVSLSDPAYVPQVVAATLSVSEPAGQSVVEALADVLQSRLALIVLDNCEHVLAACASLAHALLYVCPDLKILATSLQPLGLPQEKVWSVPPMSVSDSEDIALLKACDSVRLFVERAAEALPSFTLTPENAATVSAICRRLDGLPLAIELAAARVKMLSPAQIADRLDDAFHLLTRGRAGHLPRHQTLRATMDWSYQVLSEPEQVLLHRLSIFAGSFTLEMVESICADEDSRIHPSSLASCSLRSGGGALSVLHSSDTLDFLSNLADKSFVSLLPRESGGHARYRLLETVRQYAREKLETSGEATRMRARLLEWVVYFCEQAEPHLKSRDAAEWTNRLELNLDNIRAALRSARVTQRLDLGMRLAGALWRFWQRSGYIAEGYAWCEELLSLEADLRSQGMSDIAPAQRAWVLHTAGRMAIRLRDLTGERYARTSLDLFRQAGDPRGEAHAFELLGRFKVLQSNEVSIRELTQQALALFRAVGDEPGISRALNNLGVAAFHEGNYRDAQRYFEESLIIERRLDAYPALQISNLADVLRVRGDYERARQLFEESLALAQRIGEIVQQASALGYLAEIALNQGDISRAERYCREAIALGERSEPYVISDLTTKLGYAALLRGSVNEAQAYLEEGLRRAHYSMGEWAMGYAQNGLGLVEFNTGRLEHAEARFRDAITNFRRAQTQLDVIGVIENLAAVLARQGQAERAARMVAVTRARREVMGAPVPLVDRARYDHTVNRLRATLGDAAYLAVQAEALGLTLEQVVADAPGEAPVEEKQPASAAPVPAIEPELKIYAFGAVRVIVGESAGTAADWTYTKSKELLFYLLTQPLVTKAQIGLDLWPDASATQLRSIFHSAMHHLRKALGRPEWIVFADGAYCFNRGLNYWYDVHAFEERLRQARAIGEPGSLQPADRARAVQLLEDAVQLWRGDFLEDLDAGEWAIFRREELRRAWLGALVDLGRLHFADARYRDAAEVYRRILSFDNYLELAHRELMRCYARQGEVSQALRHYQHLREVLHDELRADPSPETTLLYERLRRGDDI